MKNIVYIKPADGKCQDCGATKELRPYGKGGTWVCFQCAMKDEDEAKRQFGAILNGADAVIIDARGPSANAQMSCEDSVKKAKPSDSAAETGPSSG